MFILVSALPLLVLLSYFWFLLASVLILLDSVLLVLASVLFNSKIGRFFCTFQLIQLTQLYFIHRVHKYNCFAPDAGKHTRYLIPCVFWRTIGLSLQKVTVTLIFPNEHRCLVCFLCCLSLKLVGHISPAMLSQTTHTGPWRQRGRISVFLYLVRVEQVKPKLPRRFSCTTLSPVPLTTIWRPSEIASCSPTRSWRCAHNILWRTSAT